MDVLRSRWRGAYGETRLAVAPVPVDGDRAANAPLVPRAANAPVLPDILGAFLPVRCARIIELRRHRRVPS